MTNKERVAEGLELLAAGLHELVDEVMTHAYGTTDWPPAWAQEDAKRHGKPVRSMRKQDVQVQLRAITERGSRFKDVLSHAERGYAAELREARNKSAHGETFSSKDARRVLETAELLLHAVGATDQAEQVRQLHADLGQAAFRDQSRNRANRMKVALKSGSNLRPWRELITPHTDVMSGDIRAAEFAADLYQVSSGKATDSAYSEPAEFFARTHLTAGLRNLLTWALKRLSGDVNASPVINLQTNFGGGKTHALLALYHLFSGLPATDFPPEIQDLVEANNGPDLRALGVRRVAIVGGNLQAGAPTVKDDGTEVHTLWGELAWQLGGREGYELVAAADRNATNPGQALRDLIELYSPALILIDEWVAYARLLITDKELPGGSFDTQFTFAQQLTEVVRSVPGAMLVVSIPAGKDGRGSDNEVGGDGGYRALERLQNVIGRTADHWRPSDRDESFEIVRRRLFQPPSTDNKTTIAAIARNFGDFYRNNSDLFPRDTTSADYEQRFIASYPLHPELLDRLYENWSTLNQFQLTRGVLRLVAAIVRELWQSNDASPLILPGNVPLDADNVNVGFRHYLEDKWEAVIDSDIVGESSVARQIDQDNSNLGQRFLTQRIARTIFIGAAPRVKSANKGLSKQYLWLGTAVPGDALGDFGSAIDRLAQRSTHFYVEDGKYWFDTQPSIMKTANDYADRLRGDDETVWDQIIAHLRQEEPQGTFDRVHVAPSAAADIPDLEQTRLVIVGPRYTCSKDGLGTQADQWIRAAIESQGAGQRSHRNTLIFLVAGKSELEQLESVTRSYLSWVHVKDNSETYNLTVEQSKQTAASISQYKGAVVDNISKTFIWAVYPTQSDPTAPFELAVDKVPDSGKDSLAARVSNKLRSDEQLITDFGPENIGMMLNDELDALWRDRGEVTVGELWDYCTRYPYMPRLATRAVLDKAVAASFSTVLNFVADARFAVAAGKDTDTGRYYKLVLPPNLAASFEVTDSTLLVEWERAQLQADAALTPTLGGEREPLPAPQPEAVVQAALTRFFGSVKVDPERYRKNINYICEEIIEKLAAAGVTLDITIEIQATKPDGFEQSEIRTITENANVLKFDLSSGFE